jgi:hypothetical protein
MRRQKHFFREELEVDSPFVEKDAAEFEAFRNITDGRMQQKWGTKYHLNDCTPCN